MLKVIQIFVAVILLTSLTYGQAQIEISITFSDGVGGSAARVVGLDPSATDGKDAALGEVDAPPLPPVGGFDVRFTLPGGTIQTFKDIRNGDNTAASIGNKVHTVNYQLGANSTGLQISWSLPFGVGLNLKDPFGGVLFNVDYPTNSSNNYTVTNLALTSLLLTVKYVDPPFPVELTSFTGALLDDRVQLRWETATEVNNYGFEIERKSEADGWTKIGFVEGHGNSNSPKSYVYEDNNLKGGSKFEYRLKQIDADGKSEYSDVVEIEISPANFKLNQNYPNPFNPSTTIKFGLPTNSNVRLTIYNQLGEKVETILENDLEAGYHTITWNASNLASGLYFYELRTDKYTSVKKLVLIK